MAIFNPTVSPGRDDMPSWLKSSQPISDLVPDKSAAIGINTAATAIEGGAQLAEQTAKDVINEDVRKKVEPIRDDFTKELELGKAVAQQSGIIAAPVQGPNGGLVLQADQGQQPVPAAIDSGVSKVNAIQSALASGKINDTYYHQRLKDAVTGLRSNYPGFVDYIDQKVAQITGVNPANAYINDLMQDINQRQSQKKSAVDTLTQEVYRSGFPHHEEMLDLLQRDGDAAIPKVQRWLGQQNEIDGGLKRKDGLRKDSDADKETQRVRRESEWTEYAGNVVANNLDVMVTLSGMDHPVKVREFMQDLQASPGKYPEEVVKEFASKLAAQKALTLQQLQADASRTGMDKAGSPYSYNRDVGAEKIAKINDTIGGYYDPIIKALMDGGPTGPAMAFYHANHAIGMLASTTDRIATGPAGEDLRTYNVLRNNMGDTWATMVNNKLLQSNFDKTVDTLFSVRSMTARAQPDPVKSYTFKDFSGEALDLQKTGRISESLRQRYLGNGLKIIDDVTDKEAPAQAKINALKFFFSPEGQGTLGNYKDDYFSTEKNSYIPGKQTVWNKMTAENVVHEVRNLAKTDPGIASMYKNWIENEAGSQLYMKDIAELNRFTGHDDVHIRYHDGGGKGSPFLELIQEDGKPVISRPPIPGTYNTQPPGKDPDYMYRMNQVVGRLNNAIAGMDRVQKGLGGGTAADNILGFMNHAMVQFNGRWTGLPAEMMNSIAAASGKGKLKDLFEQQGK